MKRSAAAEEMIVELWQQKVDDLIGPRKNSHVYQEIAAEMQVLGYDVNSSAMKIKIENLTAKYRKVKSAIGTTGVSPASWPLYEQVYQIIGGFSINKLDTLIEESFEVCESPTQLLPLSPSPTQFSPMSPSPLPSTSSSATDRSGRKKQMDRLVSVCESLQSNFSEAMEQFSKTNEDLLELEKAKLVVMQELQKDTKRLTNGVFDFLNKF